MNSARTLTTNKFGKGALGFIFSVVLLDIMGVGLLMPIQAYIVRQYSKDALMVAMIPILYAAAQFIAAPLLGKISDRIGRRPVILYSLAASAIGYLIFGIGGALWVLFLSRLIDGFGAGSASTAGAYVADVTQPHDRAKNYGFIGMAFGLGFIVGPTLGGLLSQINLNAPVYAASILSVVASVVGFFILPESLPIEKRETKPLRLTDLNPFTAIIDMLRRPMMRGLLLAQLLYFFVFHGNNNMLSVFLIDKFNAQPWQIAIVFGASGLVMGLTQGTLVATLVKRFQEKKLTIYGLVIQAGAAICLITAPVLWMSYPVAMFNSVGTGLVWPTFGAMLANGVSSDEQGKISGISTALGSLMSILGPLWAGITYDRIAPVAPFWMSVALFIFAGFILVHTKVQLHNREKAEIDPITE